MPANIFEPVVWQTIQTAQSAAHQKATRSIIVDEQSRTFRSPFPSPGDWRDNWIYFLMIDRFNNPMKPPEGAWDRRFDFRHGGTFKGVLAKLRYLEQLGVKTIWLSPVLKNSRPDWRFNYHGYGQQDFMNVDERFSSDGVRATAEKELTQLIEEAHARGMYVVLDIILNHSARVFDYAL
jgi:glycosidase